jgi:hypothetical protein
MRRARIGHGLPQPEGTEEGRNNPSRTRRGTTKRRERLSTWRRRSPLERCDDVAGLRVSALRVSHDLSERTAARLATLRRCEQARPALAGA